MLVRNTALNLFGLGAPLVAAVLTIPPLVAGLGDSRFGLLTLLWAVVSYFGLFDLGIGRALTRDVSMLRARSRLDDVIASIWTASLFLVALGAIAGLALAGLGPTLLARMADTADTEELRGAARALGLAMPFILLAAGLRGVLEADGRFVWLNALRAPYGIWTFVAPLAVVHAWGARLDLIAEVLAWGRVAYCALHVWPVASGTRRLLTRPRLSRDAAGRLLSTGGWLTACNVIGPLMGYLDRFLVGTFGSASAIAHYATPQELVLKLLIVPSAITSVLFPQFAAKIHVGDRSAQALAGRALRLIALSMGPVCAIGALASHWILASWISAEFAERSHLTMSVLLVGAFINGLATVPFTALQSAEHARTVALLQAIELPIFLGLFAWLVPAWGATGGAVAWTLRIVIDCAALFALGEHLVWKPLRTAPRIAEASR